LLHIFLIISLAFSLKLGAPREKLSIYRVTLRPFSPLGGIQSTSPGGGPEAVSASLAAEKVKIEESPKESKMETPEKGEALRSKEKQKLYERWKKAEIDASMRSPSQKGEKTKKERDSDTSLQEALEDINKKVALDRIQKRVERRTVEGRSGGRQAAQGQPPSDSSKTQAGSSSKGGSGSGSGSGSGVGIGSGSGGYPVGGVPWGSPQGSSAWSSKLDDYYTMIWAKVKKEWTLPENLQKGKADLETVIVVVIERDGKIQKSWFEKRSGNTFYDQMAMRAILKAEPFPPIPDEFIDKTFEVGIRFFPE
jgi:TonB family protein